MPPLDARQAPRNWGLFLMFVLAVEFWVIVASTVAESV
jgi:hypothetical protein